MTNRPPIIKNHEVRLFRSDEKEEAGRFWYAPRDSNPLAMFLYANSGNYGYLYIAFPKGWGITEKGHKAIIETGTVSEFKQGVEIIVWMPDVEIESVISTFFNNLGILPSV